MAQRVNITTAARLTGRSERTIRGWLSEDACPLSVELGPFRGGRKGAAGRTRWLDVEELRVLHEKRGGTSWYPEHLPAADVVALRAELAAVQRALEELRADVQAARSSQNPVRALAVPLMPPAPQGNVSELPPRTARITMPLRSRRIGRGSRAKPLAPEGDALPEVIEQVRRFIAAGIRTMPPEIWDQLPRLRAGWMAFSTWCGHHNLNPRAVEREVYERRRMPEPTHGAWRPSSGGVPIVAAYSPEQQEAAIAYARTRWPERWRT